jgi:RimJ/RimL family protein N-acetyltransferase
MVNYAFKALGANRVRAACNPENTPSWKVMEKIGLKKEGLLKKRFFIDKNKDHQPTYTDELLYGLHVSDWRNQ